MSTVTLRPNGEGDETDIGAVIGADTHWEAMSDDSTSSYVQTDSTTYERDLYALADSSHTGAISNVRIVSYIARTRSTGTRTAYLTKHFKIGSTIYNAGEQTAAGTGFSYGYTDYADSPDTGTTWTWIEINAMQIGVSIRINATGEGGARSSEVNIIVTFTASAPTVTIQTCQDVVGTTATGRGGITDTGGGSITAHGHCWNTTTNPTISGGGNYLGEVDNGAASGTGAFTSAITNLTPGTGYYTRAWATNLEGTSYSDNVYFVPPTGSGAGSNPRGRAGYIWEEGSNLRNFDENAIEQVKLNKSDVDDTPVDGATDVPISSNYVYDHVAAADPHTGYVLESLYDAKGDLLPASADNTPAKLTVGANNKYLVAASGETSGLKWQTIPATDVEVAELSAADWDDVQDYINFFGDRTILSGGAITDNGNGTAAIASLTGWCKVTDNDDAVGKFFNYGGGNTPALDDLVRSFVYLDYNGGTPRLVVATSLLTHGQKFNHIQIGTIFRNDTILHWHQHHNIGIQRANVMDLYELESYTAARVAGMVTSAPDAGLRKISITAGVLYEGIDREPTSPFDTPNSGTADATEANKLHDADGGFASTDVGKSVHNTTDDTYAIVTAFVDSGELTLSADIFISGENYDLDIFSYWWTGDSGSNWTEVRGSTLISNSQYNNIAVGLADLTANRYGVHWVYMDLDGSNLHIVYGQGNYTANEAEEASVPLVLPPNVSEYSVLIAKIILQEGQTAMIIALPWTTVFISTLATDHGSLGGLGDEADHPYATLKDGTRAFTGDQSMGSNKLTSVTDPTSDQDAATKKYVDDSAILKAFIAAKGDIIAASGNDTPVIVSVGDDDKVLVADSGAAGGVAWADPIPKATDWKGSFSFTTGYGTTETDISALFSTNLALTTRRKYSVKLDLTAVETDGNFTELYLAVKEKIDGTNYRAIDRKTITKANIGTGAEPGIIIDIPASSENIQITMEMAVGLASNRTIYYAVVKEHLE